MAASIFVLWVCSLFPKRHCKEQLFITEEECEERAVGMKDISLFRKTRVAGATTHSGQSLQPEPRGGHVLGHLAAKWPGVADWGRQKDQVGTAEKAPQQHYKRMARWLSWTAVKAVCRAATGPRLRKSKGHGGWETGRTQARKSHIGLGEGKAHVTHRLLI